MTGKTTVAVLGAGIMGAAMARNLLKAGMEVRVWNRSREKAEPLAAAARGLRMALAEAVAARFDEVIKAGYGEEDLSAIYKAAKPDPA